MAAEITQETIRSLSAGQLELVENWVQDERKVRAERHKQETLAKIKELARSAHIGIRIEGARGRPAKRSSDSLSAKSARQ